MAVYDINHHQSAHYLHHLPSSPSIIVNQCIQCIISTIANNRQHPIPICCHLDVLYARIRITPTQCQCQSRQISPQLTQELFKRRIHPIDAAIPQHRHPSRKHHDLFHHHLHWQTCSSPAGHLWRYQCPDCVMRVALVL